MNERLCVVCRKLLIHGQHVSLPAFRPQEWREGQRLPLVHADCMSTHFRFKNIENPELGCHPFQEGEP